MTYGELRYEGEHIPPLVALDAERLERPLWRCSSTGVLVTAMATVICAATLIYTSTFSQNPRAGFAFWPGLWHQVKSSIAV